MRAPRHLRSRGPLTGFVLLLCAVGGAAWAADRPAGWELSAGVAAGAVGPDTDLADYRWDTTPTAQTALQALVSRGPLAAGLRVSRWSTTQGTGLADDTPDPRVGTWQGELVARVRVVTLLGVGVWASGQLGRMRLAYEPDQVVIPGALAGEDLTVDFAPITETTLGAGLVLQRRLGRRLDVALEAERTGYAIDTAHRRGDEIVSQRQDFANWSLRLGVAWAFASQGDAP